jgi:hypothetical protein
MAEIQVEIGTHYLFLLHSGRELTYFCFIVWACLLNCSRSEQAQFSWKPNLQAESKEPRHVKDPEF